MFFKRILLATTNKNKYKEFRDLLPLDFAEELIFAPDIAPMDVDEPGETYVTNAYLKARAWADISGIPSLADDSGIEVEALDWRPGVHSARIVEGSDSDRNTWILKQMEGLSHRRADFVAAVALAFPGTFTLVCEGICKGQLAWSLSGGNGFGYDPLFIPDGYDCSFGELSSAVKNKISHRAQALKELLMTLKEDYPHVRE